MVLLSMLMIGTLFADSPDESAEENRISAINFHGLKRTREKTALQIIRPIETGIPFSETTEESIVQKLREAGIFNPEIRTESRLQDEGIEIDVYLKDAWTLIPVPVVSFTKDGSWSAGLLALESNFLGYNKFLGLGFFTGSEGWSFLNLYQDSALFDSKLELSTAISLGLDEIEDQDAEESVVREYQADNAALGLGLSYPLTERFSLRADGDYDRAILRNKSSGIGDLHSAGAGLRLIWDDIYYDIPYEYGLKTSIRFNGNRGFDGTENYPQIRGKADWAANIFGGHQFALSADNGWGNNLPAQKMYRLGGRTGSLTLPSQKIPADRFANVAAAYNFPLRRFSFGTLSAKAFYEAGSFSSDISEEVFYHGPGGGLELFINDLAIPAVQFIIGWNLETGRYQFTAGIGSGGGDE